MSDKNLEIPALKENLLSLLDDSDIREKLRQIMVEPENLPTPTPTLAEAEPQPLEGPVKSDLELLAQVQDEKQVLETEINKLHGENSEMKAFIEKLRSLLGLKETALNDSNQTISPLNQQKGGLESDLTNTKSELYQYKQNFLDINDKHESLQGEFGSLKQIHEAQNQKMAFYRESFEEDLRIKELYDGLSSQTKLSTEGIFKDTSIKGLIACGIQDKNISNLWEYAKTEVVNGNNPDQERIIRLFELLFGRYILAYPMFALQPIAAGDKFDTQSHIKHNSSINMSGSIQEILFRGYVNTKTDKVIKPSVVVL